MSRTVAIVEDDAGIRDNLGALLNGSPGCRCVGACASGEELFYLLDLPFKDGFLCAAGFKLFRDIPLLLKEFWKRQFQLPYAGHANIKPFLHFLPVP